MAGNARSIVGFSPEYKASTPGKQKYEPINYLDVQLLKVLIQNILHNLTSHREEQPHLLVSFRVNRRQTEPADNISEAKNLRVETDIAQHLICATITIVSKQMLLLFVA